jgi:hypothetical protein
MRRLVCVLVLSIVACGATSSRAATPAPYASAVNKLNERLHVMLKSIARHDEQTEVSLQPSHGGLRTIVRVRVHPYSNARLRTDLTKDVNEYIDIHQGACRTNTSAYGTNAYMLNPVRNGVSVTTLDVPISTLLGQGNVITTHYGNGTVIDCGRL